MSDIVADVATVARDVVTERTGARDGRVGGISLVPRRISSNVPIGHVRRIQQLGNITRFSDVNSMPTGRI